MADAATYLDGHDVDRRQLLRNVLIGGGAVAAAIAAPGVTGVAQAAGGKSIVLDVDANDFNDFEATGGGAGAFYVSGVIHAPGTSDQIGVFLCWGYIPAAAFPVVTQEFDIAGRGKILIAGVESDAPRGVIGGTGDFANTRGQGDLVNFDPDFGLNADHDTFTIAFSLTGASGRPIT